MHSEGYLTCQVALYYCIRFPHLLGYIACSMPHAWPLFSIEADTSNIMQLDESSVITFNTHIRKYGP